MRLCADKNCQRCKQGHALAEQVNRGEIGLFDAIMAMPPEDEKSMLKKRLGGAGKAGGGCCYRYYQIPELSISQSP